MRTQYFFIVSENVLKSRNVSRIKFGWSKMFIILRKSINYAPHKEFAAKNVGDGNPA